ncbi:PIN domain nuclease of toxin-antitoxin system [Burkholderia sp. PvR073]
MRLLLDTHIFLWIVTTIATRSIACSSRRLGMNRCNS